MTLRALFYGCWLSHDLVSARDARGLLIYRCQACGEEIPVLQTETVKGPAFYQVQPLGQPKTTTFRETKFGQKRSA